MADYLGGAVVRVTDGASVANVKNPASLAFRGGTPVDDEGETQLVSVEVGATELAAPDSGAASDSGSTCASDCKVRFGLTSGTCMEIDLTCCATECVNLMNDVLNCGACGHACPGPTPFCAEGVCRPSVCVDRYIYSSGPCEATDSCCTYGGVDGPPVPPPGAFCYPQSLGKTCRATDVLPATYRQLPPEACAVQLPPPPLHAVP